MYREVCSKYYLRGNRYICILEQLNNVRDIVEQKFLLEEFHD